MKDLTIKDSWLRWVITGFIIALYCHSRENLQQRILIEKQQNPCVKTHGLISLNFKILYSSFKLSKATRTASTTNAEKVQSLPFMAVSISLITSFGNRIVLLLVGGMFGILNTFTAPTPFWFFKIIPSLLWVCQYYIVQISLSAPFLRFLQQLISHIYAF